MALTKEEIKLAEQYRDKWYSQEEFKKILFQKRQDDFLNSIKNPTPTISQKYNNSKKNITPGEDRQWFDLWVNTGEAISNFWKSIKFESKPDDWIFESAWKFIANIPWNLLQIWGWWISLVSNPIWTGEAIKEFWASTIENWMNKLLSTDIWQDSMRWLWEKMWAPKEATERNLEKIRNGWFYTNKVRENIWKWIDKFWNDLYNDPTWTIKKVVVENPADIALLWSWLAASTWSKLSKLSKTAEASGNIQKAEKLANYAEKAKNIWQTINPFNIATKTIWWALKWTKAIWETLTSKISWLNPDTLKNIVKNPDLFRKVEKGELTKEKLANNVVKNIDERIKEVWELWKKYDKIREWKWKIKVEDIIPRNILEKYDIKITDKWLDFSGSAIWSSANKKVITNALNLIKWRKIESWKDILNLRRALDDTINYKTEATDLAKNIVRELRKNIDNVAKEQIPGLNLLDKKYWAEVSELEKIKKYIFNRDWTLKDDYIQKISNLTWAWKEKTLERIKKLVPEIEHEINAIKAFADVELAKWQKVWSYMQAITSWTGFAVGWVPWFIAWATISNPSVVANLLKHYWASKQYIANISNKVKNWIKLNNSESSIVSKLFQNEILADKVDSFATKIWAKKNFMPEESKSFVKKENNKIIQKTNNKEIPDDVLVKIKNNIENKKNFKYKFNTLSKKAEIELKNNWIDTTKIKGHSLSSSGIQHILKRHWEKAKIWPNEVPVKISDIKLIPKIINSPDNVKISKDLSNSWEKVLIYEKNIGDKYYYLEYIDNSTWYLTTKTMYINKKRQ